MRRFHIGQFPESMSSSKSEGQELSLMYCMVNRMSSGPRAETVVPVGIFKDGWLLVASAPIEVIREVAEKKRRD